MWPLKLNSLDCQESIARNRFLNRKQPFDREHPISSLFWFSPQKYYIWTEFEISSKKRVLGRISKNSEVQSIPESLENSTSEDT